MNIYDISKSAGVSIATVSRVINNSGKVSEKTRLKVLDTIARNGYVPCGATHRRKHSGDIGILEHSEHSEMFYNLSGRLENIGIVPRVVSCDNDKLNIKKALDHFSEIRTGTVIIDGRNLAGYSEASNSLICSFASDTTVILIGAYIDHPDIYCITCPEHPLVTDIVLSYLKKGITDIVYLFSSMNYGCMDTLDGYRNALSTVGISDSHDNAHLCSSGKKDAYDYISGLISKEKTPRLVITSDDRLAVGALKAAINSGISVPGQLEIIGTGNTSVSEYSIPEISTIDCHMDKMCEQAVMVLTSLLNNEPAPTRIVLNPVLIKKGTTL